MRRLVLGAAAFGIGLSFIAFPSRLGSSASSPASLGIPRWPWLPGGMTWKPRQFTAVPFSVNQIKDSSLPQGQQMVVQPGAEGTQLSAGSVTIQITPPSPATVAQGTEAVHQLAVNGTKYTYDRVISMMTTAYNGSVAMNGPSGAVAAWNGAPLKPGDVAVDPTVIPLGTYLYIDGYGPARAVDTGSAVSGDHVDLFFNESSAQISQYGIQHHKVYVLTAPPPGFSA